MNGLPVNLIISLLQCVFFTSATGILSPLIGANDLLFIHGANTVDYTRIIYACVKYLDSTVGKEARNELLKIGKYRSEFSQSPRMKFKLWLHKQKLRYRPGTNENGESCGVYEDIAGQSMDDLLSPVSEEGI